MRNPLPLSLASVVIVVVMFFVDFWRRWLLTAMRLI